METLLVVVVGPEAPRNSLDSPLYDHTTITMTSTMRQKPPKGSTPQDRTTAKNVIHKDIFPSQPSVIARLMGIGTIPVSAKRDEVMIHAEEVSNLKLPSKLEMITVTSPRSATFRQSKCSLISYGSSSVDYTYRHCLKKMRPRRSRSRQHHPQEELLEKIREDFQAWQTSKALENARTVFTASGCPTITSSRHRMEEGRYIQILAQENLHKEKMAKFGYGSCTISMAEKDTLKNATDNSSDTEITSAKAAAESNISPGDKVIKVLRVSHCATMPDKFRDLEDEHNNSISTSAKPRSQKRIVLLKPSTCDIVASDQESLFSSSKVKREGNMEEFLEEVKERLKKELKLKSKSEVVRRSWGTTDPKQIARDIAKQIRETVRRQDLGKRLYSRSESFRAFRSDRKRNAAATAARNASPEHVSPTSVTSRTSGTNQGSNDCSPPIIRRSRGRIRSLTDMPLSVSVSESVPASGFDDQSYTGECKFADANVVSPRALVRSFSAPASGISRGRLFAEDNNVDSGRHGNSDAVSEGAAVAASKNSSSFSLRGTVSNLRNSLRSRANKLFGKKTHWSLKPSLGEFHPHKMAIGMLPPSPPEILSPFIVAQASTENFTELPPSPVSPLEVKGSSSRHFFSDLNCNLPELSPKSWSEFDTTPIASNESSSCKNRTNATETEESYTEMAYIKQVLIAVGLYEDGSSYSSPSMMNNARVDSMARRPICDYVFDEVEETYNTEEDAADHRMLFDLANEALEITMMGSTKTGSSLWRWVVDSTGVSPGRKLLVDVWQQVQSVRNPPVQQETQTVESMVAREAWTSPWIEVLHEDSYVLGRKLERAIFDQLIADIVQELFISQNAAD
ncbi:Os06g0728200 [Oryza sativa Japonica Group]|uniref:Os06g0728200 protein n=1 Tax=Oryza sativa subsp. japonica TaxID=39947 RepID=A0A0P0X1S3_ORYSJ|nr:Os06g0728200 [Oryza sativa Japonica Group]